MKSIIVNGTLFQGFPKTIVSQPVNKDGLTQGNRSNFKIIRSKNVSWAFQWDFPIGDHDDAGYREHMQFHLSLNFIDWDILSGH